MNAVSMIAIFCVAWAGFGVVSGWVASRLDTDRLSRDRGPLRLRRFEADGSWYRRRLHIHRWKDRLPEAGALFGGESKAALKSRSPQVLDRFATETRRAELVHWANLAFGFTFLAWAEPVAAWIMVGFGVVVHLPFIAVQRYNRARIGRLPSRGIEFAQPWSWRRRILVGGIVGLCLVVVVWATVLRPDPAREVTLSQALQRLGDTANGASPPDVGAADIPREGVYRYEGDGNEGLVSPSVSQRQGPQMPGTVIHTGRGCWSFRIDYSTKHAQTWDLCRRGGDLIEIGGSSTQQIDLKITEVGVTVTTRCDPGTVLLSKAARAGDPPVQQRCRASSSSVAEEISVRGASQFIGVEPIRVDGTAMAACHIRHDREMSGGQTGSERLDLWLDCRSGLPLRNERRVRARTDSPIGKLTYTEEGSFILQRLDPTTRCVDSCPP